MTYKEQRIQKQKKQIWNFDSDSWGRKLNRPIEKDKEYMNLHHNIAAAYYVAHQNAKAYKILYPLCALMQLGIMVGLCAAATPKIVKVASMIVFPLSAATTMRRKDSALEQTKQAKDECHHLLSRFENFEQMPPVIAPFRKEYPAIHAQVKTVRGTLLKLKPFHWRGCADLGAELWKSERQNG